MKKGTVFIPGVTLVSASNRVFQCKQKNGGALLKKHLKALDGVIGAVQSSHMGLGRQWYTQNAPLAVNEVLQMEPQIVTLPASSNSSSVVQFPARRAVPAEPAPKKLSEEELRQEIGRRFNAGELVLPCYYCGRPSMRWKPNKIRRPFGQCSNCWAQIHLKADVAEDRLLAEALEALSSEYNQ